MAIKTATTSRPRAFLHGFRPLDFGVRLPQDEIAAWLRRALARTRGGRGAQGKRADVLYARLGRGNAIETRVSVVADYARRDWRRMTFFRPGGAAPWFKPSLETRMALFEAQALSLVEAAFPKGEAAPDVMVQVSCTGYASPHAVQRMASRRGWGSRILHVGHMGCYASVPAVSAAAALARAQVEEGRGGRAALFFIELCSLHLRPESSADEQVVVNSLFADGAIRFDVSAVAPERSLALLGSAEALLPDSEEDMSWRLRDSSFAMTLSREVPARIGAEVAGFAVRFLKERGLNLRDVAHFAIHPGGPRVIESVLRALGLPEDAARHSRDLLRRRGNMSSSTLPHVWGEMLADPGVRRGEKILSLAFGPGLTAVANLLEKR